MHVKEINKIKGTLANSLADKLLVQKQFAGP